MYQSKIYSTFLNLSSSLLSKNYIRKMSSVPSFKTLSVTVPKPFVYHVELNRPEKLNAMNNDMWIEIGECFDSLNDNEDCRVVLLSGAGKLFSAGIDFNSLTTIAQKLAAQDDVARRCKILRGMIIKYQNSMSSLENCLKPVIALVHTACIGGGVDLITAADIRYCTEETIFQVKEVDIGMAADVGTLQRLPKVIGSRSLVNELVLTARKFDAKEALNCGLVSKVWNNKDAMVTEAVGIAEAIAKKSPVAIQLSKRNMIYSRDHTVQEGLNHIADWNQTMLQSEDFMNASVAQATKSDPPIFAKL